MKQKKFKQSVFLFGAVLYVCGLVGCGKRPENDTVSTQTAVPTQVEDEVTSTIVPDLTRVPMPEAIISPAPAMPVAPEPVTFPVEINEMSFPEPLLRRKALAADADGDTVLSEEEAKTVTKLHLKKLADADAKDAMEDEPLPEYSVTDFVFDLEGIQYFTELSELTVNLLGGEAFVEGGNVEEILVETKNFSRLYECTKLKKLFLYEVDIPALDISGWSDLKRLEVNCMHHLKSISVGNHETLSALWISECHALETIDLSELERIKTVDIVRNDSLKKVTFGEANGKLETIQLNGLRSLNEVDVSRLQHLKTLNLTDVALAGLDVSKNTELGQLCAERLHLDTLDLRNNPKISYLINDRDSFRTILLPEENCIDMIRWTNSAVTEFPIENLNPETLTGIDIQGTAIKKLDVSGYPNLEYLYYDEDVTEIVR